MFWRILKKDLKRKKVMNVILLLFIILCSMFAAASVNNIIAVTGGIDHYFDMADVPDVEVQVRDDCGIEKELESLPSVKEIRHLKALSVPSSKSFIHNGEKLNSFINPAGLLSDDEMVMNYFDKDNNIIKDVEKGTFYATAGFTADTDIREGDDVTIKLENIELTLKYMGYFKGALFPTDKGGNPMLILDSEDYENIERSSGQFTFMPSETLHIYTDDPDAVAELAKKYDGVYVSTREDKKAIYIYDMLTAYIMMAISIVLMITAFVVLRFTIGFSISEEIREIGVMKAVGLSNGSIRILYIIKYLAIAAAGSVIGFFCSLPLQDMMMKAVSKNMVLGSENSSLMGLLSCAGVVAIIMLFCYMCTRRVKKLSPIDAVRSGQTGERFGKKSILHLGKSKLPSTGFMALNDVLSSPKRFSIIALIFALCLLIVTMMSNFALTLKSEKILWTFSIPESDAHIMDTEVLMPLFTGKADAYKDVIEDVNEKIEKENMPGKVTVSLGTMYKSAYKDKTASILYWVTKGENEFIPNMDKGSAPQKPDEIALTGYAMDSLGAGIGDRITAEMNGTEHEFLVTGQFSTFMGGGYTALLHKDFELPAINSTCGIQIKFDGSPDKETIQSNISRLRTVYDTEKIYNTSDMIKTMTGMSDTLSAIKKMMMILTVIVTAMIVILMERSFISKEKSEIALMKAVGIPNKSIVTQHTLRFVIAAVLACIIALAALMPASNLLMNYICSMIGDISGIKCDIDPLEIFVICPIILLLVTAAGSFLTAIYTKTIKASDTASIE